MKYYTTIITSLILSAILLINNTASAASYTGATYYVGDPNTRGELVETYTVQYVDSDGQASPVGDQNVAVYEFNHTINLNHTTTDGYINGSMWATFTQSVNTPTGWNFVASQITYTPIDRDSVYSFNTRTDNSEIVTSAQIRTWFYNFFPRNSVSQIGNLKIRVSFSYPASIGGSNDPNSYIGGSLTISGFSRSLNVEPNPVTVGTFVDYIIAGINNSYVGQDTTEINTAVHDTLTLLRSMAQTDSESYEDIIDALASNNEWNAILSQWLNSISTDTLSISQNTTEMLSFLSTYLPRLRTIDDNLLNIYNKFTEFFTYYKQQIDQGNSAASSAAQEVQAVESKANIINDVYKPPVDGYIDDIELRITPEVSSGMTTFLAFINRPYFVLILTMVFSLAFVSYLLYGKGV